MRPLGEVFQDTPNISNSPEHPSPMPRPGSISEGGKLTTMPQARQMPQYGAQSQQINSHGIAPESSSGTNTGRTQEPPGKWSISDKSRLSKALEIVCALQKQYGKTPHELGVLVDGFAWRLEKYPVQDVIGAIGQYIDSNADIPSPADIMAIINPPPAPPEKLSTALYIELKKRAIHGYISPDERDFCQRFETQETQRGAESRELVAARTEILREWEAA